MALDPRIKAILQQHLSDLSEEEKQDVLWEVRNGTYAIKHKYVELIGRNAGVEIQEIKWLHLNPQEKVAWCECLARMGERWAMTTGEAAPYNNKNTYPLAMAEKRAIDRAVLKLVGLHGLVYSEDEADEFKDRISDGRSKQEPVFEDVAVSSQAVDDGLPFDEPEPARSAQVDGMKNLIRRIALIDEEKAKKYEGMAKEITTAKDAAGLIRRMSNFIRKAEGDG